MNQNVLVVDDDADILFAVKTILEDAGLQVTTVNSGRGCLETIEKGFRGLILLDIMMPEMDGWDTIKAIVQRGFPEHTAISMLTAKHVPDCAMEELKEYVLNYIRKPFDADELITAVKKDLSYI